MFVVTVVVVVVVIVVGLIVAVLSGDDKDADDDEEEETRGASINSSQLSVRPTLSPRAAVSRLQSGNDANCDAVVAASIADFAREPVELCSTEKPPVNKT